MTLTILNAGTAHTHTHTIWRHRLHLCFEPLRYNEHCCGKVTVFSKSTHRCHYHFPAQPRQCHEYPLLDLSKSKSIRSIYTTSGWLRTMKIKRSRMRRLVGEVADQTPSFAAHSPIMAAVHVLPPHTITTTHLQPCNSGAPS